MAQQTRNTLLSWVVLRWKPSVTQVKEWMESFWHKEDKIPIASVDGLSEVLNSIPSQESIDALLNGETIVFPADGTYVIPAGFILTELLVVPGEAINLKIGTTPNGVEVLPEIPIPSTGQLVSIRYYAQAETTIYITGITTPTTIKFYKKPGL